MKTGLRPDPNGASTGAEQLGVVSPKGLRGPLAWEPWTNARVSRRLLESAGLACQVCTDLERLCVELNIGAAAVVVPEEAVLADHAQLVACAVQRTAPGEQLGSACRGRDHRHRVAERAQPTCNARHVLVHVVGLRPRERRDEADAHGGRSLAPSWPHEGDQEGSGRAGAHDQRPGDPVRQELQRWQLQLSRQNFAPAGASLPR